MTVVGIDLRAWVSFYGIEIIVWHGSNPEIIWCCCYQATGLFGIGNCNNYVSTAHEASIALEHRLYLR